MARGWESKDIESQRDAWQSRLNRPSMDAGAAERQERERKRESLQLSRTRVMHDLDAARNPRHQEQLQKALSFLESEIAKLG
ncbi:MAG: hypothetical protein JJE04_09615 [Acidobacteriia bacterium]|nr:hypothetical protein [Terriglobia bacterium]